MIRHDLRGRYGPVDLQVEPIWKGAPVRFRSRYINPRPYACRDSAADTVGSIQVTVATVSICAADLRLPRVRRHYLSLPPKGHAFPAMAQRGLPRDSCGCRRCAPEAATPDACARARAPRSFEERRVKNSKKRTIDRRRRPVVRSPPRDMWLTTHGPFADASRRAAQPAEPVNRFEGDIVRAGPTADPAAQSWRANDTDDLAAAPSSRRQCLADARRRPQAVDSRSKQQGWRRAPRRLRRRSDDQIAIDCSGRRAPAPLGSGWGVRAPGG